MKVLLQNKISLFVSLFVAILFTFLIFYNSPPVNKYLTTIISENRHGPKAIVIYEDVFQTERSDKILFIRDFIDFPAVLVFQDGKSLFQWNLTGKFVPGDFYCFGDINNDKVKELFVFTFEQDSIFLNAYNCVSYETIIKRLFVTDFRYFKGKTDFWCYNPKIIDLDNDGVPELLVNFYAGFAKIPRKLCRIDLMNQKIITSSEAGTSVCTQRLEEDIDNDGKMEVFGNYQIFGNCREEYPYSDLFGWLMLYNDSLDFKFTPFSVNSYSSEIYTRPYRSGQNKQMLVLSRNASGNDSSFIGIYTAEGNLLRHKKLEFTEHMERMKIKTFPNDNKGRFLVGYADGLVEVYDSLLNIKRVFRTVEIGATQKLLDIDLDGSAEEIYISKNNDRFFVARNDYSSPVEVGVDPKYSPLVYLSVKQVSAKKSYLVISVDDTHYTVDYAINPEYKYRYLIWTGYVLGIFSFILIIGWIAQFIVKRRYDSENQIRQNQLRAIEQQLNPHFTLNILNGIGSLYEKHETQKAQYYFGKYSKLLRTILLSSGQISTSLGQELEFTRNFLELEEFRLNHTFSYTINVPDLSSVIKVPRLLLHTFVENAIKHGIRPLVGEKKCSLAISGELDSKRLLMTITDDGAGRNNAVKSEFQSTGKGLEIMKDSLKLYEKFEGTRIKFEISDLTNDAKYPGTRVLITIPLKRTPNEKD